MKKIQSRKEMKREKILKIAYNLFMEKGYEETRIVDIAENAKIAKGTVYDYFKSKEEIIDSLVSRGLEDYMKICQDILESSDGMYDKIKMFMNMEDIITSEDDVHLNKLIQNIVLSHEKIPDIVVENIRKMWKYKFEFVYKLVEQGVERKEFKGVDKKVATLFVMGAAHGFMHFRHGSFCKTDEEFGFVIEDLDDDVFIDMMMKGIGK